MYQTTRLTTRTRIGREYLPRRLSPTDFHLDPLTESCHSERSDRTFCLVPLLRDVRSRSRRISLRCTRRRDRPPGAAPVGNTYSSDCSLQNSTSLHQQSAVILSGVTGRFASSRSCGTSGHAVEESLFDVAVEETDHLELHRSGIPTALIVLCRIPPRAPLTRIAPRRFPAR
jgi:hypothetical protein